MHYTLLACGNSTKAKLIFSNKVSISAAAHRYTHTYITKNVHYGCSDYMILFTIAFLIG